MSTCCGINNNCRCSGCEILGVKLNQFPANTSIASGQQIVLADNTLVSFSTLSNAVAARIVLASAQNTVIVTNAQSPYTLLGTEDIIMCTGVVTINLMPGVDSIKSFTVNADGGTVTLAPDGTDTVQTSTVTSPNSARFGFKTSTTEWRVL